MKVILELQNLFQVLKTLKFNFMKAQIASKYILVWILLCQMVKVGLPSGTTVMPKWERIALLSIHCTLCKYLLVLEQPDEIITPILQVRKLRLTTAWHWYLKSQLLSWEPECESECLSTCTTLKAVQLVYLHMNEVLIYGLPKTNAFRIHIGVFWNESFYKKKGLPSK